MNKKTIATVLVAGTLGLFCVAGCSQATTPTAQTINENVPSGAPPLMPANHSGRYDRMGNNSCWGCHGTNSEGKALLSAAQTPPATHFENGDTKARAFASGYTECNTCHVQS